VVGVIGKHGVDVRYSQNGVPCASLTVIVSEQGADGRSHDLLIPMEIWGRKAEQVGELEPGSWVCFQGKLAKRKRGDAWELIASGFDLMPLRQPQGIVTGSRN
jgi:hypothetical protein